MMSGYFSVIAMFKLACLLLIPSQFEYMILRPLELYFLVFFFKYCLLLCLVILLQCERGELCFFAMFFFILGLLCDFPVLISSVLLVVAGDFVLKVVFMV